MYFIMQNSRSLKEAFDSFCQHVLDAECTLVNLSLSDRQ